MLVSTYESTRRHNPEQQNRHPRRSENLRCHDDVLVIQPCFDLPKLGSGIFADEVRPCLGVLELSTAGQLGNRGAVRLIATSREHQSTFRIGYRVRSSVRTFPKLLN
jgi:hypothetical protein